MRVAVAADIPGPCALVEIDGRLALVLSDALPPEVASSLTRLLAAVDARLVVEPDGGESGG